MSSKEEGSIMREKEIKGLSGWLMLVLLIALLILSIYSLVASIQADAGYLILGWIVLLVFDIACLCGFTVINPNEAVEGQMSLRMSVMDIAHRMRDEIQDRLSKAGIEVIEARITHLAYAPEIASTMLRRQQASAIIAARQKIVEGAVSMVEMALDQLSAKHIVELDEERKASMVSNLLVVLCSDRDAQPIVNAGTLYQ
jgi:hypothetical protein